MVTERQRETSRHRRWKTPIPAAPALWLCLAPPIQQTVSSSCSGELCGRWEMRQASLPFLLSSLLSKFLSTCLSSSPSPCP